MAQSTMDRRYKALIGMMGTKYMNTEVAAKFIEKHATVVHYDYTYGKQRGLRLHSRDERFLQQLRNTLGKVGKVTPAYVGGDYSAPAYYAWVVSNWQDVVKLTTKFRPHLDQTSAKAVKLSKLAHDPARPYKLPRRKDYKS
jgi:hypothetical protein